MRVRSNPLPLILFGLMGLFILSVSIAADLHLLPLHLITFPYYDKLGHFVLYGLLGALLHLALRTRSFGMGRARVPIALVIIALLAALDELQQGFMPSRSLDFADFAADMIGVLVFIALLRALPALSPQPSFFSRPFQETITATIYNIPPFSPWQKG